MPRGGKRIGAGRKFSKEGRRIKTSITLTAEKLAKLEEAALKTGKTRSEIVEELIEKM